MEHSHPIAAFESPADLKAGTGNHPGSHIRCAVIHDLLSQSRVGLSTRAHSFGQACTRLPPRHSFQLFLKKLISGKRIQKLLPIHPDRLYRFGTASTAILLARAFAPFVVELFAVCFYRQNPEEKFSSPVDPCRHGQTPYASCVTQTFLTRAFHPDGHGWLWFLSRRQDLKLF